MKKHQSKTPRITITRRRVDKKSVSIISSIENGASKRPGGFRRGILERLALLCGLPSP